MKKFFIIFFVLLALPVGVSCAEVKDYISPRYVPSVSQTTDENGFIHPGVTFLKEDLERMQSHVRSGDEPWKTAFLEFAAYSKCALEPRIHYGDGSDAHDYINVMYNDYQIGRLIRLDSETCLDQVIMWYITGVDKYRTNAMQIIRSWSKMQSLSYMNDEQLYFGVAMYKLTAAAEILRYSNYTGTKVGEVRANVWTEEDTAAFTHLLELTYDKYNRWWHFMNQHGINNMAFMASSIFRGSSEDFALAVERTSVNSAYDNPRNGSIISVIREVEYNGKTNIQHVEMGRDQGHAYGDIGALSVCALTAHRQGALVDPKTGKLSDSGISVFDFADHRLLYGANYISAYNLGHDVVYYPVEAGQTADWQVYENINDDNRGLLYPAIGMLYNYYKYERNWDMGGDDIKYVTQAYEAMLPEGDSLEFPGFSTLLFSGEEALGTEYPVIPAASTDTDSVRHLENRTRAILDGNAWVVKGENGGWLHFEGNAAASYAPQEFYPQYGSLILRVRTTAHTRIEVYNADMSQEPFAVFEIPDTSGEWVRAVEPMGERSYWERMTFFKVVGEGECDIDYMDFSGDTVSLEAALTYSDRTYITRDIAYMYSGGQYVFTVDSDSSFSVKSTMNLRSMGSVVYVYPSQTGWQNISIAIESGENVQYINKKVFVFRDIEPLIKEISLNHRDGGSYTRGSMERFNAAADAVRAAAESSCLNKEFVSAVSALAEADSKNFDAYVPVDNAAEPILHYAFDRSSRGMVADSSPYGNDGISVEAPFGGGEVILDGGYVLMPKGILANADSATISVTFTASVEKANAFLWTIANSSDTGYIFLNHSRPNGLARAAITLASYPDEIAAEASSVRAGVKTTAVTVIGGGKIRLYINGRLAASADTSLTPRELGETAMNSIGKSPYASDPLFEGSVSDFRIYNRALSEGEIRNISDGGNNSSLKLVSIEKGEECSVKVEYGGDAQLFAAMYSADGALLDVSVDETTAVLKGGGAFIKVFAWDNMAPKDMIYIPLI